MSFELFIKKWGSVSYPPKSVGADALAEIEGYFGSPFPHAYKSAALTHGLPSITAALLNSIVDRELDVCSIGSFLKPNEIIPITEGYRRAGMPNDFVGFATDGGGNLHGFRVRNGVLAPEVWFFDHDFLEVDFEAPDFDAWIERYCGIEPVPEE